MRAAVGRALGVALASALALTDVAREVVQDRLPAVALCVLGVRRFAVERHRHDDTRRSFGELDRADPVPEGVLEEPGRLELVYSPAKSKPEDPSFASMRDENLPPSRRSTVLAVVCQSGEAVFQTWMSSGELYARQTSAMGAWTMLETVIFMVVPMQGECGSRTRPMVRLLSLCHQRSGP